MSTKTYATAIQKSLTVTWPVEAAFRMFMDVGSWWPRTHSHGRTRAQDVVLESRVGGRFFGRYADGEVFEIGNVVTYDPPQRVVFTWKNPDFAHPTEVEVRFDALGERTRIELIYSGPDRTRTKAEQGEDDFRTWWDLVLEAYVAYGTA
jgi:uncharacterized protein YndB with AHSA1/START domain